jgi:hypothetical protein
MQIRKLPIAQGLAWFRAAIDLGAHNPKAVFGAALLFIAVLYGFAIVMMLASYFLGGNPSILVLVLGPLSILVTIALPILLGGLMHVIREAEHGRPAQPRDLFAPLRSPRLRGLVALGLLQLLIQLLSGMLMIGLAGPTFWQDYFNAMSTMTPGTPPNLPVPDNWWLLIVVQLAFYYFTTVITLFAVPLVLFSGETTIAAVRDALRASVRNIGANFFAGVLFVVGTLIATIIVVVIAALVELLGRLIHPVVGQLLTLPILLAFGSALLVVLAGGAYLAWRDTFEGPTVPPRPFPGIEV